ncbi:hypothetical protein [Nocardioides plantarum]|uniref:Uncharacterized protein n=1 Tax=Nocardioides plantarum TaxID=29299 RepID=A0ABV5K7H2_9ACTN|nr:hypothetical protein [Nocardioides plantarum]
MVWTWLAGRITRPRPARLSAQAAATPPDLRAHLPLLWPDGPGQAVDEAALTVLGRGYARAGRTLQDLLEDLDVLCAVVGIGTSSRMIEASSVAWSDAFLDGVGSSGGTAARPAQDAEALTEVERLLGRLDVGSSWGDLVPPRRLLIVTWPAASHGGALLSPEELSRVVRETRRVFPRAAVAAQPAHDRVVAAVAESPSLPGSVAALTARCAELAAGTPPTVSLATAEAGAAVRLLRPTG